MMEKIIVFFVILMLGIVAKASVVPYEELEQALEGRVSFPKEERYNKSIKIDNKYWRDVKGLYPAAIAYPEDSNHIQTILKFIRKYNVTFNIKGGGHSAAAYCLNKGGLVIDMKQHRQIRIDEEAAIMLVRSGWTWSEIYKKFLDIPHLIPIGGTCVNVGLEGFIQGGGYSFLSRSYGLGIDNVDHATIITWEGEELYVSATTNKDLFWAIRGGGGGNFGIITSMALKLQRIPEYMYTGNLCWPIEKADEVLAYYNNEWDPKIINDSMAAYGWYGKRFGEGKVVFCLTIVYNGPIEQAKAMIQPLMNNFQQPTINALEPKPFAKFLLDNANLTSVDNRNSIVKSWLFPPKALNATVRKIMANAILSAPSPSCMLLWDHGGGAISKVPPSNTAFFYREHRYAFELKAIWTDPKDEASHIAWAQTVADELAPYAQGSYVNYIDPELPDWRQNYYGDHLDRLKAIKLKYDPHDLFTFPQSLSS